MNKNQRNQSLLPKFGLVILLLIQMFANDIPLPALAASSSAQISDRASAKTWHVPGNYASIQPALDAASDGDTILVDPGTYPGSLDFKGKDVSLQSQTGPLNTTIKPDYGAYITIGPKGMIIGFTISGGTYSIGIHVFGDGTAIKNNIINNTLSKDYLGGASVFGDTASPIIEGNIILYSYCESANDGGAVRFTGSSSPQIINNIFDSNLCSAIKLDLQQGNTPQIINNTIVSNSVGIHLEASVPVSTQIYRNNILYHNGIGLEVANGNVENNLPVWENNIVFGNNTDYTGIDNRTGVDGNISVDPGLYLTIMPPDLLHHDSPAIDAGSSNGCPSFDIRGNARPRGAGCDIGAYEGYNNLVMSIDLDEGSLPSAPVVQFTVGFLEPVTGVDTLAPFSDFAVTTNGITGAAVTGVSGSGNVYHVSVDTGSGSGSLRLDVIDDDSIVDLYSLPLGGAGAGNGNFTSGYPYTTDKTNPTVVSILRASPTPTQVPNIDFKVTFSEAVNYVDAGDFRLTTTGTVSGAYIKNVEGYLSTYTVTAYTGTGLGTIRLDMPAGASVTDQAELPLANLPYLDGESYPVSYFRLYMPLTINAKIANIYGFLSTNGYYMYGPVVKLRFYDGSSWSTLASDITGFDGSYGFNDVASLKTGQRYAVCFNNDNYMSGVLWAWCTKSLVAYTAGDIVNIGNFDIAGIGIVAPPNDTRVTLPYTFQWTPRPATPTDSYEFDLYDFRDGSPYFYTPKLGYVGAYKLKKLPTGFKIETKYAWEVWVYSPDGGYGISYPSLVGFSNRGSSALDPGMPTWLPDNIGHDWENLPWR